MAGKQLRLFTVEGAGEMNEGTDNAMELILNYANRYSWRPSEVERVLEMGIGQQVIIEELTIRRIR